MKFDIWQSLETEPLRQELVNALERLVEGLAFSNYQPLLATLRSAGTSDIKTRKALFTVSESGKY